MNRESEYLVKERRIVEYSNTRNRTLVTNN